MTLQTSLFLPQPGIKKDGTVFSSRSWVDGQWVRFQRGLPRKIGGYKQVITNLNNVPRKVFVVPNSPNFNVYVADYQTLQYFTMDQYANAIGGFNNRTPNPFSVNLNNNWKLDTMFSTTTSSSTLIAHAAQSLSSIDNTVETPVFYGDATGVGALLSTGHAVSGGFVILHPFLFMFGNDGDVRWTVPNDPTTILDAARVCGSKIVAGFSTRGGNTSPAGLLWALDSVIRVTQISTSAEPEFRFDTITDESSILSSSGIVEYDGYYYWVGLDRFYVYNGTVQELKNDMNSNYFFDNLNYQQRQKVWATKVPRFGEVWFFYPSGTSAECNSTVIYNIREDCWYSSTSSRSAGYFTQIFTNPIWTDNAAAPYSVWAHEMGTNQVNLDNSQAAIDSHIESPLFSNCAVNLNGQFTGVSKNIYLYTLEPDFIQSGAMSLIVNTRDYAASPPTMWPALAFNSDTRKIDLHIQGREVSLTIECAGIGSNFQMGQILITEKPGDDRP